MTEKEKREPNPAVFDLTRIFEATREEVAVVLDELQSRPGGVLGFTSPKGGAGGQSTKQ